MSTCDYSDDEPNYFTGSDSDLSEYNSEDDSDENEEHGQELDEEEVAATHCDLEIDMEKIDRDILDLARQAGNTESKEDIFASFDAFKMTKWQTKMWEKGFRF
jgi:transketolase